MSPRSLLALAAILALAIGAYAWLDRPEPAADGAESVRRVLLGIAPQDAVEVVLEDGGRRVRLERGRPREWRLVEPFDAEADPDRVASLIERVRAVPVGRLAAGPRDDPAPFGLDPAEAVLTVVDGRGTRRERVLLGSRSPVGEQRYAATEDGSVYLVGPGLAGALDVEANWFRQRRPIPVREEAIDRVRLEFRGFATFELSRDGEDWRLEQPWRDRARSSSCQDLVRALAGLTLERIDADFSPEDERAARVRVFAEGRTWEIEVLGAEGPGVRRVRRSDGTLAGAAPVWHVDRIVEEPSRFLDLRLVYASNPDVLAVEFRRGKNTTTIRRSAPGGSWRVAGASSDLALEPVEMESWLHRLRDLLAIDLGPAAQPFEEDGAVTLTGSEGTLGSLEYREAGEGRLLVRSTWRPGVIFVTDPSDRSCVLPPLGREGAP